MGRAELETALAEGGSVAQLKRLLAAELTRSAGELGKARSGYDEPVTVVLADGLLAVTPLPATVRADPDTASGRAHHLLRVLIETIGEPLAGVHEHYLALQVTGEDPELAALLFDEAIAAVDRLKARALIVPAEILAVTDLRALRRDVAEEVIRPHADPDPSRRVARRMLLTLRGKGKWGGYHSEVTNLARGFKEEWDLAEAVGEALIGAGLLLEKPSVGQRHGSLNPRRKGDIDRLVDDGVIPEGLTLPDG
jgi:hypothetical protein